jgi:hypothetical protein
MLPLNVSLGLLMLTRPCLSFRDCGSHRKCCQGNFLRFWKKYDFGASKVQIGFEAPQSHFFLQHRKNFRTLRVVEYAQFCLFRLVISFMLSYGHYFSVDDSSGFYCSHAACLLGCYVSIGHGRCDHDTGGCHVPLGLKKNFMKKTFASGIQSLFVAVRCKCGSTDICLKYVSVVALCSESMLWEICILFQVKKTVKMVMIFLIKISEVKKTIKGVDKIAKTFSVRSGA